MKSNVYLMLESFFDRNMIDIAKELNYSTDNILILQSDENRLQNEFPETYKNLMSCTHNRDSRLPIAYAQDLICSWIFEDYLLENLKENGLDIRLSGNDKLRKILNVRKVSSNSDYLVTIGRKNIFIELANDYKGYWKKNKVCDLRDDKFKHIQKMSSEADFSLLLGIDFSNRKFFILDVLDSNTKITYRDYHWAYHKPVYSLDLNCVNYYDFDFLKIVEIIKEITDK